ncbi:MAG TPA: hypothetical protein VGN72_22030 [Tepidisphaeraceae bacterium]|jgi:hypothetical protein|nr:hypothetical protein [Tepidisphaeraceae bacterium]
MMFSTAARLRLVRQAHERFLAMAALDCIMDKSVRVDFSDDAERSAEPDREGADHVDESPDWTALLRGGVLDD